MSGGGGNSFLSDLNSTDFSFSSCVTTCFATVAFVVNFVSAPDDATKKTTEPFQLNQFEELQREAAATINVSIVKLF